MMTILQGLVGAVLYPMGAEHAEYSLIRRGLSKDDEFTAEVSNSPVFCGAVADCLVSLLSAPDFSEADKRVSLADRGNIRELANRYYRLAGEPENVIGEPAVTFGWGKKGC